MNRKSFRTTSSLLVGASLTLCLAGTALADDSSMSMYTGDSYAYFNNLDYSLGKFNVARAATPEQAGAMAKAPARAPEARERRILLAARGPSGTRISPFRDDTGA